MEAAAELYDRYAGRVYALARRIVRNDDDAEDVVQEVFSQAWRNSTRYDPSRGTPLGWLLTITRTRAIDTLRSRAARPDMTSTVPPDSLAAADAGDPVECAQQTAVVRAALLSLPEPQRDALELAYYEGLTQAEIAARLSEPLGTIKTRMRTALLSLRTRLRSGDGLP